MRKIFALLKQSQILRSLARWIDSDTPELVKVGRKGRYDLIRGIPLAGVHLMCLAPFIVGWSWVAVITAIALYVIRMFAITGFYHRYFSHRTFKTNRVMQFLFAVLGNSALQRGPLWWAANHRHHHLYADKPEDFHSPLQLGFVRAHVGWVLDRDNFKTRYEYVKDWVKFPELVWLNRFDIVVPVVFAVLIFLAGQMLAAYAPELQTNGIQMLVWGFFISSIAVMHATFTINSFDHMFGFRRYNTDDTSRNNVILAILTLGEGWHNNHHHYAVSNRNGFYWWEIDMTYYLVLLLSFLGIVRDIRPLPLASRESGKIMKLKEENNSGPIEGRPQKF